MKYIFILLCALMMTSVFAETIGEVEYHLPESAQNWEIDNKIENDKGTTLIYIPQGTTREDAQEFFGVNSNTYSISLEDVEAYLPKLGKNIKVLEKNETSLLLEWSEENGEEIYCLSRFFSTKEGSVGLMYQTKNLTHLETTRSIWLPALKAAHN